MFLMNAASVSAEDRGIVVVTSPIASPDIKIGRQYAVLIAIDKYLEWNPLRNPVRDAKEIKEILSKRYFVDEFIELYDEEANSAGIRQLFGKLVDTIGPTDSVLIYYAGHGHIDRFQTGFWIPVDGSKNVDSQDRWIPNQQIRNFISQMKARSVMVVADSCFSGDLLDVQRGASPVIDSEYYQNAMRFTARQILTSGSLETVPDESEFTRQFKKLLETNAETYLDSLSMYDRVRRGVTKTLPLFGTLPGHESGGNFLLFLRDVPSQKKNTTGTIRAVLEPSSAFVSIDSGQAQVVSSALELEPGIHYLVFQAPGFHQKAQSVSIEAGIVIELVVKLEEFARASIEIPNPPYGTSFLVGDTRTAVADAGVPIIIRDVPAGRPVRFSTGIPFAERLDPAYERTLTLEEGARVSMDLPVGKISLPFLPDGSACTLSPEATTIPLTVDGNGLQSPLLAAGTYAVAITGPYPYSTRVTVENGKIVELPGYREAMITAIGIQRDVTAKKLKANPVRKKLGWASLGVGITGSATATLAYFLGAQAWVEYKAAVATVDVQAARAPLELYGTLFPVALSVSAVGFGLTPVLWFGGPDPEVLERSIAAMDESLRKLRGE